MKVGIGITLALLFAIPANAQWVTEVQDDLFADGNVATMMGIGPAESAIYITCNGVGEMSLAYIERDGETEIDQPATIGTMVIKADNGERWENDAEVYRHNSAYLGMRYLAHDYEIRDIVEEIGDARESLSVGIRFWHDESTFTRSFSASGSTAASRRLLNNCIDSFPDM